MPKREVKPFIFNIFIYLIQNADLLSPGDTNFM